MPAEEWQVCLIASGSMKCTRVNPVEVYVGIKL